MRNMSSLELLSHMKQKWTQMLTVFSKMRCNTVVNMPVFELFKKCLFATCLLYLNAVFKSRIFLHTNWKWCCNNKNVHF